MARELSGVEVLAVSLSTSVGGTDHSLRNLALALRARGVTVTLGAPGGSATEKWWRSSGLPFLPLDLPQRVGIRRQGEMSLHPLGQLVAQGPRSARTVSILRRAARDFDVLHSNHLLLHLDAVLAARLARKPVIVEFHDIVPAGAGRVLLAAIAMTATRTVAVSSAAAQQLPARAARRASVVHQGIDTTAFAPGAGDPNLRSSMTADPDAPLIAAVGRIDREKNLDVLIDAVARVRRSGVDAHLAIVGAPSEDDGGYLAELQTAAARLLPGAYRFLGRTDMVASTLRAVDVLACPSQDEPFGLIALEAQACAVPVVASDTGGLVDFVTDEWTGLVARTGDADSLAAQLRRMVTDRDLARGLALTAREQAAGRFDSEHRAQRFVDIYSSAIGDKRST
ncbi:glycosyltransferase family 4 protein [Rhodococcus sp. AW25M09]|uniref:glycosyltransferase family 4 protein n=1 Tax=Rhodococcus sp. AW25M09 TaxID=1268303 RepID=UPI001E4BF707|nr:glycosyltransferase family 4 protein [Rhodococcus sp. AW25M09]